MGVVFGAAYYLLVEFVSVRFPSSLPGRVRTAILTNPICAWFRLRDGWAVWPDAGTEAQYHLWRKEWDRQRMLTKQN